jgi:arsenate reductase (thioredoxin)
MRKQKVLFLCTQNSARSQIAEGLLRHLAGDRFEVMSAGLEATDEVHPCAVAAMKEVGIDISGQRPKGLSTYTGKEYFNYLIIVCARAEKNCPKTFPGVGTTFWWIFEDPRRDEDLPYDSMLERFRVVRDQIELKIRGWLERPEEDLKRLREERERERRERLEAEDASARRRPSGTPSGAPNTTPSAVPEGPRIGLLDSDGCPSRGPAGGILRRASSADGGHPAETKSLPTS